MTQFQRKFVGIPQGPASILFGRIEPGGLVNLVSKQPLATPYYDVQQQFGSFDFYRTTVDATGPITQDDTLAYRFNLAYENAGSFREFFENERIFVSPVLRWNISQRTQATFELQYKHVLEPEGTGIPAIGNRPAPLPRETNLGEPGVENRFDDLLVGFNWSHAFNDHWILRHRFNADFQDEDRDSIFGGLGADNRTFNRFFTFNKGPVDGYYTTLDLTGTFATWGLEHTLLLGLWLTHNLCWTQRLPYCRLAAWSRLAGEHSRRRS